MIVYDVIDTLSIGENTAVLISGDRIPLKNGASILDENGETYEVISVGMSGGYANIEDLLSRTSLLIKGHFSSTKLYVLRIKMEDYSNNI